MNEWTGTGVWSGWRLTTDHAASSYNQPVLVDPDGNAFGPGDINSVHQVVTVSEAASILGVTPRHVQRMCKSGILTSRYADGIWLILRSSLPR